WPKVAVLSRHNSVPARAPATGCFEHEDSHPAASAAPWARSPRHKLPDSDGEARRSQQEPMQPMPRNSLFLPGLQPRLSWSAVGVPLSQAVKNKLPDGKKQVVGGSWLLAGVG